MLNWVKEMLNRPRRWAWLLFCLNLRTLKEHSDTRLAMFAVLDVCYVWWITNKPWEKLIVDVRVWGSAVLLLLFSLLFTCLYRGWCLTNDIQSGSRRSGWPDASFWLFIVFTLVLMIPPWVVRQDFILFQIVFPPVVGAIVGWGAYLDGRLLYRTSPLSKSGNTGAELSFIQMLISQITGGYAFAAVTVMLGISSIDILFGIDLKATGLDEALPFGAGVLLIIGQLHYLITLRLFVRCEELIQADKK